MTLRDRVDVLLARFGVAKQATLAGDVKACCAKVGIDFTTTMEAVTALEASAGGAPAGPVVTDLTQDSDDEPSTKRARTSTGAPADTKPAPAQACLPWETPEWKAKCAARREAETSRPYLFGMSSLNMEKLMRLGSDEELWCVENDPPRAERLKLERWRADDADGTFGQMTDDHIDRSVAKVERLCKGPCRCVEDGPDKCMSQTARQHACGPPSNARE